MQVPLVKTSSLGGLAHTFPAVTDAARAVAGLHLDWLAEEPLVEVCRWHPAAETVIPVSLGRRRTLPLKDLPCQPRYEKVRRSILDTRTPAPCMTGIDETEAWAMLRRVVARSGGPEFAPPEDGRR